MIVSPLRIALLVALAVPLAPAAAQGPKPPAASGPQKPSTAPTSVRYIQLHSGLMGDLEVDGFIKETRQGNAVVAAELDLCHAVTAASERRDRVVVTLRGEGNRFSGTGESTEEKAAVAVQYTRQVTGRTLSLRGTIKRGSASTSFELTELSDLTEAQFRENTTQEEPTVVAAPTEFGLVAPTALLAVVDRRAVVAVVRELRPLGVRLVYHTLVQDCAVLRAGRQTLRLEVEAERAPSVVARLRALPGVAAAGWTNDGFLDWSVRFAAGDWRAADGTLPRDTVGPRLSEVIGRALSATAAGTTWDAATGRVTLRFKRPTEVLPDLGLTETIEIVALLTPDRPGASDRLLLTIDSVSTDIADEGLGPRLTLFGAGSDGGEDGPLSVDAAALAKTLARDLKGQHWDNEAGAWR